jgi:hypothetical protein
MSFLSPSMPSVPPAPKPVTREDPAVAEARRRELLAERARTGRQAQVVTGAGTGAGLLGPATVVRPTLLGQTTATGA